MLLSLKWLREFVPYEGTAEELGDRLTMLGLELEEIRRPFKELEAMVVGYVKECGRHPDADKLSVCLVDVGAEVLNIVCGAPNVARGQYVVVAPVGAVMPDGLKIKKARLRGRESSGMICSERELGLSDDHSGILVLSDAVQGPFVPGRKAVEAMNLDTEVLDISLTPNRGDCLSVLGLAREVAALYKLPLTMPALDYTGVDTSGKALEKLQVEVRSGDVSSYYYLRSIEDVRIGPSPAWMRWRLQACGQRAISNLVDVTNYVMLELGQPLHSFDLHKVRGGKVIVDLAREGERMLTLDGQERILTDRDITIRDPEGPIGLGGVMGGGNSDIDENSTGVLLEGAVFNQANIRYTSKRLSLPSEAAYRNERGVDQNMTGFALERATVMIARLGKGRMSAEALGRELKPWVSPEIELRRERAELLIGVALAPDFCREALELFGCKVSLVSGKGRPEVWKVTPPSHRLDLEREADLIEEIARLYGFDRIPETIPSIPKIMALAGQPEPRHKFWMRVKNWAAGLGLNEAINYSFVGHKDLDHLGASKKERLSIVNPLSDELDALRTVIAPGLLNTLRNNLAHGNNSQRFFELASAFTADPQSETTAHENMRLAFMLYGERFGSAWPQSVPGKAQDMDYLDLKGLVEAFLAWLHLPEGEYALAAQPLPWLLPCVELRLNGKFAGTLGRVKPALTDIFHARKDVWLAELDLDVLYDLHHAEKVMFKNLPAFPPVRRDITVIAPLSLKAAEIEAAIRKNAPATLESLYMLDLFQPEGGGERNLTWRLVFRDNNRTLKDAEVDKLRDNLAQALVKGLNVRI